LGYFFKNSPTPQQKRKTFLENSWGNSPTISKSVGELIKIHKKREAFASHFCLAIVSQIEALLIISSFYKIMLPILIGVLYFNWIEN